MTYILHIDTSTDKGLVAIGKDGKLVAEKINPDTRNHASVINSDINEVLRSAGIEMKDLDAISVCGGPGSYTGLRIGLSTAKGLCYILEKPLLMSNRLTLLAAENIYADKGIESHVSILEARANEYFIAVYDNAFNILSEPHHILEEELAEIKSLTTGKTSISGEINDAVKQTWPESENIVYNHISSPNTETLVRHSFNEFNSNRFVNLAHSEPYYLKKVYTHKPKNTK